MLSKRVSLSTQITKGAAVPVGLLQLRTLLPVTCGKRLERLLISANNSPWIVKDLWQQQLAGFPGDVEVDGCITSGTTLQTRIRFGLPRKILPEERTTNCSIQALMLT
jgi:hypothetical protein